MPKLENLWIYPVKSCGAVAVESVAITPEGGLARDREWIVTEPHGNMLWQGDLPRMTMVRVRLGAGLLTVATPDGDETSVPVDHDGASIGAKQYGFDFDGTDAGEEPARLLSDWLSHPVRLVRVGGAAHRWPKVNSVSVLGIASIEALNARLAARGEAPMVPQRFRPNLLLSDLAAFEEEATPVLDFGDVRVTLVETSIRCELVNISLTDAVRERQPLPMIAGMSRERATARKGSFGVYSRAAGTVLRRGMTTHP